MTRQVTLDLLVPSPDGDYLPALGEMTWRPNVRRKVDDGVVLPRAFSVTLDGEPFPSIEVDPTGPDWCWRVTEQVARGAGVRHLVVPPGTGQLRYSELVEVDPATLEPIAEPEAAWWLALQDAQFGQVDPEVIDDAVQAKVTEHVESETPHPAYDEIPDLTLIFNNHLI